MQALEIGVNLLLVYLAIGLVFAIAFVATGVSTVDAAARGAGVRFRLLILPGIAACWPLMFARWLNARRSRGTPEPPPAPLPESEQETDWTEVETIP